MLKDRIQPQLEMEIFSRVVLLSVCSMTLESSLCKPTKHVPCGSQTGHLDPIALHKGAATSPAAYSTWLRRGLPVI